MTEASQLDAILHTAAFGPITDKAFLRITGSDATRWLNGMVTNNIKDLAPGKGNYNFLLNAQGRIQGDCTIYREPGDGPATYLLETDGSQLETVQQILDKFIIMDDVELAPAHTDRRILLLLGEQAGTVMENIGLPSLGNLEIAHAGIPGREAVVLAPSSLFVPRYELITSAESFSLLRDRLTTLGLPELSAATLEQYRMLEARPLYGKDIRNTDTARDLPQETGQTHALNFNKGCYLGQEIVERIHSRGNVHRQFSVFQLQPAADPTAVPTLPAVLQHEGKPVGELTSATYLPLPGRPFVGALGYVRREAYNQTLTYPGGTATAGASTPNPQPDTQNS